MVTYKNYIKNINAFLKTNFGIALLITLIWVIVLSFIGYIIDASINGSVGFFDHTVRWDSGWYIFIANDHYLNNPASAAFYPLFPLAVDLVRLISFNTISLIIAGQIVNIISLWFVVTALLILGEQFLGKKQKLWLVALVLSAPTAFFMHAFYSEALFMALGFWAYIHALRRNWLYMAILLAILTSARLPSILFIGLCGLEFMRAYDWNIKKVFNKKLLYFLLSPAGFVLYGLYLIITNGNFFAMFSAYKATNDWAYQIFDINFIKTILRATYQIFRALIGLRPFDIDILINHLLPIISLIILGSCSLYLLLKQKNKFIPLGIFGLISIIMFTLNSNVVSVHRYVLPCLTIYVAIALLIKENYQKTTLIYFCIAGIITQIILYSLFIANIFAG